MVLPKYSIIFCRNDKKKNDDGRVHICNTRRIFNTPIILLFMSSIQFWDVSKYCHVFKNKSH